MPIFYAPHQSLTGEAADMDLALVSGRGPDQIVNLEGRKPYVRDEDIVVFAHRDAALAHKYGSQDVRATDMTVMDLGEVRKAGAKSRRRPRCSAWEPRIQRASGFISTSTFSTMPSCRRWITA
jgi:hypothetical protein